MNTATPAETLLTYLFVPGDRPERFTKAVASGADRVIIDLEDAVAPANKAAARSTIAEWLQSNGDQIDKVLIRINDAATAWHAGDLAWAQAASRAAGLASPIAGVTPDLDPARVTADMRHAKSLGFGAKMCIHPAQLAAVLAALAPTAAEVAWAERVLQAWSASGSGAIQLDGKMVDRPVVLKAERIMLLASRP